MGSVFSAFAAGVLFALGLGIAGMTDPAAILDFLDVTGNWNPNLAFVLAAAVAVTAIGFRLVQYRSAPWFASQFPSGWNTSIDTSLIVGSSVFGIGWGLVGYCPGPAIVALSFGETMTWVFVGSMLAGMLVHRLQSHLPVYARATPQA